MIFKNAEILLSLHELETSYRQLLRTVEEELKYFADKNTFAYYREVGRCVGLRAAISGIEDAIHNSDRSLTQEKKKGK